MTSVFYPFKYGKFKSNVAREEKRIWFQAGVRYPLGLSKLLPNINTSKIQGGGEELLLEAFRGGGPPDSLNLYYILDIETLFQCPFSDFW